MRGSARDAEAASGGLDVLVDAEEIRGVVFFLDGGEAFVIVAVGGLDALLAFLHHEIDVRATGRKRMESFPIVLAPIDDFRVVRGIGIHADDDFGKKSFAKTVGGVGPGDALGSAVDGIEMHGGVDGGNFRAVLDMAGDGFVGELGEIVGAPIPLKAGNVEAVKDALRRGKWGSGDVIQKGMADRTHGLGGGVGLFGSASATPDDAADILKMEVRRKHGRGRNNEKRKKAADVLGSFDDEIAIGAQDGGGFLDGPEGWTKLHRADGMKLEFERGGDAEIAAAAANGPEEVGVFVAIGSDKAAVGENHVHGEQVVNGEAVAATEIADAAAEGQAGDAGAGDEAGRCGQAEGVGGVVHVAPDAARFHADRFFERIHADAFHAGKINDQTAIAERQARAAVAAAANGSEQTVFGAVANRGDDVGDIGAAGDETRTLVNHGVVDFASGVVARVAGLNQFAAKRALELVERNCGHCVS